MDFRVNREFSAGLIPHKFTKVEISIPKGFAIVQERIKKAYYKRRKVVREEPTIYIVHEEKNFFVNLFSDLNKKGIASDYEFMKRMMHARLDGIENFTDAFFVIMKSIFIPNVGNQRKVKMIEFKLADKSGFVNYSMANPENYFDCNVFNRKGGYFKVYIKDINNKLDLDKVMAVISTVEEK